MILKNQLTSMVYGIGAVMISVMSLVGCVSRPVLPSGLDVSQMASLAADREAALDFFSSMTSADTIHANASGVKGAEVSDVRIASRIGQVLDQSWADDGRAAGQALSVAACPPPGSAADQQSTQIATQALAAVTAQKQSNHNWVPAVGIASGVSTILECNMGTIFQVAPRTNISDPAVVTWPASSVLGQGVKTPDGTWLLGVNGVEVGTVLQVISSAGLGADPILAAWQDYLPGFFAANISTDPSSIAKFYLGASSSAIDAASLSACVLSFVTHNPIAGAVGNPNLSSLATQIGQAGRAATPLAYAALIQALANAGYFKPDVIATIEDRNSDLRVSEPPPGLQPGDTVDLDNMVIASWLQTNLHSHPGTIISAAAPGGVLDNRFVVPIP